MSALLEPVGSSVSIGVSLICTIGVIIGRTPFPLEAAWLRLGGDAPGAAGQRRTPDRPPPRAEGRPATGAGRVESGHRHRRPTGRRGTRGPSPWSKFRAPVSIL